VRNGSRAKDLGLRGQLLLSCLGSGSRAIYVRRRKLRSSFDGPADQDCSTDHEASPAAHERRVFYSDGRHCPIELHSFPAEIEQLAPGLHGFGYVVVEEQIALVDQHTRKIKLVFPRWGE
jgi:hypothetical protein